MNDERDQKQVIQIKLFLKSLLGVFLGYVSCS